MVISFSIWFVYMQHPVQTIRPDDIEPIDMKPLENGEHAYVKQRVHNNLQLPVA